MFKKNIGLFILQLSLSGTCEAQNMEQNMKSVNSLHYVIRKSDVSVKKSPLLLLLHGYGSNENDLFSLCDKIPKNWIVVSVRALYLLNENSYKWYDVKKVNEKITINIEQEEESRKKLLQLVDYLSVNYSIDANKIVVAGFSQGANMVQSLGLSEPNLVSGFGVFSGRNVEEFTPYISNSLLLKKSQAFISHGSNDILLPKNHAIENSTKLKTLGVEVTFCDDTNGHSISTKQWTEFLKWLLNFN